MPSKNNDPKLCNFIIINFSNNISIYIKHMTVAEPMGTAKKFDKNSIDSMRCYNLITTAIPGNDPGGGGGGALGYVPGNGPGAPQIHSLH